MALIRESVVTKNWHGARAPKFSHLDDYWVMELDRTGGLFALHLYPELQQAELACLWRRKATRALVMAES